MQRVHRSELTDHPDGRGDARLLAAIGAEGEPGVAMLGVPGVWYPDKPKLEIGPAVLDELPRTYLAQVKVDGWRCVVRVTARGPFIYTSREHNPIPISRECAEQFEADIRAAGVPVGSVLDGEWVARRPACRDEMLMVFDLVCEGDRDLRRERAEDRIDRLAELLGSVGRRYMAQTNWPWEGDRVYRVLFDWARDKPWAEGIVLKRLDSPFIGSCRQCALNPGWMKVKFRSGFSGRTPVA